MKKIYLTVMLIPICLHSFAAPNLESQEETKLIVQNSSNTTLPDNSRIGTSQEIVSDSNRSYLSHPLSAETHSQSIEKSGKADAVTPQVSVYKSIIKVIGALMLVLCIIFLLAVVVKRSGFQGGSRGKKIVIRESLSLGPKEKLVLVDFAGESLLIGVAAGRVSLVKSTPLLKDKIESPARCTLGARNAIDFQHKLNEFLLKGQK
jgi:flagellar protein FliO/FliZ